jgi:hypothetical protein
VPARFSPVCSAPKHGKVVTIADQPIKLLITTPTLRQGSRLKFETQLLAFAEEVLRLLLALC